MAIAVERNGNHTAISMGLEDGDEFHRRVGSAIGGLGRVGGGPLGQRRLADRDTGELLDGDEDDDTDAAEGDDPGPPSPERLYQAYRLVADTGSELRDLQSRVKSTKADLELAQAMLYALLHRLRQGRA